MEHLYNQFVLKKKKKDDIIYLCYDLTYRLYSTFLH